MFELYSLHFDSLPLICYILGIAIPLILANRFGYSRGKKRGIMIEKEAQQAKASDNFQAAQKDDQLKEKERYLVEREKTLLKNEKELSEQQKGFQQEREEFDNLKVSQKELFDRVQAISQRQQALSKSLDIRERCAFEREQALSRQKEAFLQEKSLFQQDKALFDSIVASTKQGSPEFARQYADFLYLIDMKTSDRLTHKNRPARSAAQQVRQIAAEKREITQKSKILEYQLCFYESLFPWLLDFKEITVSEALSYTSSADSSKTEYGSLKNWLSPEEFSSLDSCARLQLALDRYSKRQKSNWQIGIEYERYIGYLYEQKGYKVRYYGATEGLEDMGRDLIAIKEDKILIIQCKRWSVEKTIHEKHIFQLYGTTVLQKIQHPDQNVSGVFVATTSLSPIAKSCADYLQIKTVENYPLKPYPVIKCNVSKTGEGIYHLPFDQQYDRVMVNPDDGDFYVSTVKEAEEKGFRHAWKWHS